MKIIIVDDSPSMCKVLAALFESKGHQVVASLVDGQGLVDMVCKSPPDLVCMDYNLPGQNGLDLLKVLHRIAPGVDVVMISGSADPAIDGLAADAGAMGFLKKPFSKDQIAEELNHVAEVRRLRAESVPETSVTSPPAPSKRVRKTAVVVDDNGSVRLLMRSILEQLGIQVVAMATDGKSGLEAAKQFQPTLVCLDVEMPVMSGMDALPLVVEACPATKVVMVTGYPDKKFVEQAAKGGAKGYLLKPVRPAHVEDFMRKILA